MKPWRFIHRGNTTILVSTWGLPPNTTMGWDFKYQCLKSVIELQNIRVQFGDTVGQTSPAMPASQFYLSCSTANLASFWHSWEYLHPCHPHGNSAGVPGVLVRSSTDQCGPLVSESADARSLCFSPPFLLLCQMNLSLQSIFQYFSTWGTCSNHDQTTTNPHPWLDDRSDIAQSDTQRLLRSGGLDKLREKIFKKECIEIKIVFYCYIAPRNIKIIKI